MSDDKFDNMLLTCLWNLFPFEYEEIDDISSGANDLTIMLKDGREFSVMIMENEYE